jgi:hypothetical protein
LSRPHWRYGTTAMFPHFPSAGFTAHDGMFEADHPVPLIAEYGAVQVVADHPLEAIRKLEEPDGRRLRAVVEVADAAALPPDATTALPGVLEGTLESYAPDRIAFSTTSQTAGLVVLDEIMCPGWHVAIDGVAATPIRANYLLRAVWTPAGHHDIVWTFDPSHWRILVGGYVLALLVIAGALLRRGT